MVLLKRKPVELVPPPDQALYPGTQEAFYMPHTNEIFLDYESYAARLSFYNQRRFQCELTGRNNLTYFDAHKSEQEQTAELNKRFPDALKGPVLRAVQFVVSGRLDLLIDSLYDRFKDRFFEHESVMVERFGERYWARIVRSFPPKHLLRKAQEEANVNFRSAQQQRKEAKKASSSSKMAIDRAERGGSSDLSDPSDSEEPPAVQPAAVAHRIGTDLNRDADEARQSDCPEDYLYHVRFVDDKDAFVGSLTEVKASDLVRDRLTFSKTILKKYMKDCLVRESHVGAPWVVRPLLAQRFGIPTSMSDDVRRKNELIKEGKLNKRKKLVVEDTSTTGNKKRKGDPLESEAARLAREEEEKRLAATKPKVIKYPIEDLLVDPMTERELKSRGKDEALPRRRERPVPSRALGVPKDIFEHLMSTYYFLMACGKPLMLSPFSLDDYEAALRHSTHEPACTLIAEVHACLINIIIRDGNHSKDLAPANLASKASAAALIAADVASEHVSSRANSEDQDELESAEDATPAATEAEDAVMAAARSLGGRWEKKLLKLDDERFGWEANLVGAIAKRHTVETLPRQRGILSHLTGVSHPDGFIDGAFIGDTFTTVQQRYPALPLADKVYAIQALCELAVMTKPIKAFYEDCESQLTELRKERVEIGRARKKLIEERAAFEGTNKKEDGEGGEETNGDKSAAGEGGGGDDEAEPEEAAVSDSEKDELESEDEAYASSLSDIDGDDEPSKPNPGSRQAAIAERAAQRQAEEQSRRKELSKARAEAREKAAENKQLNAERRRLDEEELKLNKREEAIDRDFRRFLLAPRLTPLGRDRFLDRYWWFDGVGNAPLVNSSGGVSYSTGRLYVQGAPALEWRIAAEDHDRGPTWVNQRRVNEHTQEGLLEPDEWAVYTEPEEIDALMSWLRSKGNRENYLKQQLKKFETYLAPGMTKRLSDLASGWRDTTSAETRRSGRSKGDPQPAYLRWRNNATTK